MPLHLLNSNFSGGEVSPHLYTRTDAPTYATWVKTACNFFVHPQGGASNRPGTAYINTAKYAAKACRLIPFVLSEQEAYVLEVGHGYMRVHTQAGTVLQNNSIYEIVSPYTEHDLQALNYVQYEKTLFLVHPSYVPHKLTHNSNGYFTLSEVNITDGPFMLANTKEDHKMRVITTSETVISEGVKASLSFLPIVYPNMFIQGFWRGERFYDPLGYGVDVQDIVNVFNEHYASSGCVAYNQGGVLRIESPQATGGNYNGSELIIYYRESIASAPSLVVTQYMSGGQNAGEEISTGNDEHYLEADFDAFRPGHVGALWSLNYRMESSNKSGTLGYSDSSAVIQSGGDWQLRTTGNWYGEIVVESSFDQTNWKKVKHFSKAQTDDNLHEIGNLESSAKMYYVRVRCLGISGEMGYILQSGAFYQEGIVKIENYVNARKVQVSISRQLGEMERWTDDWAEGSFSPDAGYPRCVFFYQDRLGFAGTQKEAQTIWFSKTAEYEDFGHERTLQDSDAISINLASNKLNAINAVAIGGKLLVFTAGSEWSIGSSGALTPFNIEVAQEGERGSSTVAPITIGNRTLFVQSRGSVLRDFYYEYSGDSYTGRDLTLRAKHLFFNREIKEIAYQQEPDNLVWCVLDNGSLLSMTYLAEEGILAWCKHETQGKFLSICSIPSHGYDEIWFLVERNGARYVERMLARLPNKLPQDQQFLDASISKKSTESFTEINGLDHLEGKEVMVLADGSPISGLTVTNGKITLPYAVKTAQVGLGYVSTLQTLPVDVPLADGTSLDRKRRPVQVTLKVLDSRGGYVGTEEGKLDELLYAPVTQYAVAADLQTKDVRKVFSASHSYFPSVKVVQKDPLPLTLLAVISQLS